MTPAQSRDEERPGDLPFIGGPARDALEDRISGLTLGGDDYVTKPFSLEEVVTRVAVVLRRTHPATEERTPNRLTFADLVLDEDEHQVWRAGRLVDLSPTEFSLLRYLMRNAGRVVNKAQILDHVWHYDFDGDNNILETYVSYLRRKLNKHGPPLIHTVRLVGYVLREDSLG